MNKKQFAILVLIWVMSMVIVFVTPAWSANVPMVTTNQPILCEDSIKDLSAANFRAMHLKQMLDGTQDSSARLVLATELKAVIGLTRAIHVWRVENCRES